MAAPWLLAAWAGESADGGATPAGRSAVATVVAGIVSYTRWPAETAPLRLCTLGRGPTVAELLKATDLGSPQRPVSVRVLADAGRAASDCDAVYVGTEGAATIRDMLRRLAGLPVLLVGEGVDFCSDGGMFCLRPEAPAVKFNTNLDAIARSGLRVNPLVLRIARGATGSGS